MKLELIAATTFGLEAPVKRGLIALGYKILKSEDGKITFLGDERAIVRANLWLRCSDRVQIKLSLIHIWKLFPAGYVKFINEIFFISFRSVHSLYLQYDFNIFYHSV